MKSLGKCFVRSTRLSGCFLLIAHDGDKCDRKVNTPLIIEQCLARPAGSLCCVTVTVTATAKSSSFGYIGCLTAFCHTLRHRHLHPRHVHDELLHQRLVRLVQQACSLEKEEHLDLQRDPDCCPPPPPRRVGQAHRSWRHQGIHRIHGLAAAQGFGRYCLSVSSSATRSTVPNWCLINNITFPKNASSFVTLCRYFCRLCALLEGWFRVTH